MTLHELHRELRAYFRKTPHYTTLSMSNTITSYDGQQKDTGMITFFAAASDGTNVNIEAKTIEGLRARLKAYLSEGSTKIGEMETTEERRPEP